MSVNKKSQKVFIQQITCISVEAFAADPEMEPFDFQKNRPTVRLDVLVVEVFLA